MHHRTRQRLTAGVALAALVATGGIAAATLPAAAAPAPTASVPDYLAKNIPGLREDSTLKPVTYERLVHLLGSSGTFAVYIGGPADETTLATAPHIDAVAQQYGVSTVYTFDPRVDGKNVDFRTYGDASVTNSAGAELRKLYTSLVTNYLNKDTTPQFGTPTSDPYLFIYDKAHTVGGAEDRIIASLGGAVTKAQLADPAAATSYRESVGQLFASVSAGGKADIDTITQYDFVAGEVNRRHKAAYANPETHGGDIFTEADRAGFRLQSITYPELINVLESDAESTILFGGTWCHNTRAVVKAINEAARKAGTETVYFFDLRLDSASSTQLHIRDSASSLGYLYGDLVNKYLPNLRTQYELASANANHQVEYYPGGDQTKAKEKAQKLQVPYLIQYDKDRTVGGTAAPIVKDWIRELGDGKYVEYMTEWWWIADLPGKRPNNTSEANWPAEQQKQWAFADEALAKINTFFGLSNPNPTTSPTTSPDPTTSPSPTASASPTTSPSPTSSASPTLAPTGGDPALRVSGTLAPGGRITVTGANLPAAANVRVELHSTPVLLGTAATTASGTFSLTATIPASTTPGAHSVVVYVGGVEVARSAITVAGTLAATGGQGTPVLALALGGVLIGAGAIVTTIAVRRRRAA